jgi:heme-degrading monooxygenase HmoA
MPTAKANATSLAQIFCSAVTVHIPIAFSRTFYDAPGLPGRKDQYDSQRDMAARIKMILESAPLHIRSGLAAEFELAFLKAQLILKSMPGYISHELLRCLERNDHYLLLVRWESVSAHEDGFRKSARYQDWKNLLHHFYDPFPTVLHFESVTADNAGASSGSDSGT